MHNYKHCRYFHNQSDFRRALDFSGDQQYSPDICENLDNCMQGKSCGLSHNQVENVYHPSRYKTKYCVRYPKQLQKCEYGDYCSFAHNNRELKVRLLHQMTKDQDFFMFYYKTEWCPFNKQHNKSQCVYAHNWQDFRRKPNIFNYDTELCNTWSPTSFIAKFSEGCQRMANCPHCKGWKEQEYHPLLYKTNQCKEEKCTRGVECPLYHSKLDQRTPIIAKQLRNRKDFNYDAPTEPFVSLTNVNHL